MSKEIHLPANDPEIEEVVLGAMLFERDALDIGMEKIKTSQAFYQDRNKLIFEAIQTLWNKNDAVDILTVSNELRGAGNIKLAGGAAYISELTMRVTGSTHTEDHCEILRELYIKRELSYMGSNIYNKINDSEDVQDILDFIDKKMRAIDSNTDDNTLVDTKTMIKETIDRLDVINKSDGGVSGIATGYKLDRLTHGWQDGQLIILACRPGMGKTGFAVECAKFSALRGIPTAFFSIEMAPLELMQRIIASESEVLLDRISHKGHLNPAEQQKFNAAIGKLEDAPLYVEDTPSLSISQFRSKARKLVRDKKVEVIYIDYVQLMDGIKDKGGNREQEVSGITKMLKQIARELHVPIIALAQLNREVDRRPKGERIPRLSDLRESGGLEQDANVVLFLYRPSYYSDEDSHDEQGNSLEGVTLIIVAKNRGGKLGHEEIKFLPHIMKFENIEEDHFG